MSFAFFSKITRIPAGARPSSLKLSRLTPTFTSRRSQVVIPKADIDASKLTIQKASTLKPKPPKEELIFGQTFTDHMLEVDWQASKGWTNPKIAPLQNLSLHPAASCFHYGLECFEGMKAYLDDAGHARLFRPNKNMERMNNSTARLQLPAFDGNQLMQCIKELVKVDKSWIPHAWGYSLYIRPTIVATYPVLGVAPAQQAKLFVILCPVGPYYREGFKAVKLFADVADVRAWPGGTGNIKCGGNYAMTIKAQAESAALGYAQVMWLFGPEHYVTEVGTMNQFFFWVNKQGEKELITAPLDGTILPGVTRDSILDLTRGWKEFKVTERPYTIHEVIEATKENRIIEAFGAGTAAIVSPVKGFRFQGQDYTVPLDKTRPEAHAGPLTERLATTLMNIQYGKVAHKDWSVLVD